MIFCIFRLYTREKGHATPKPTRGPGATKTWPRGHRPLGHGRLRLTWSRSYKGKTTLDQGRGEQLNFLKNTNGVDSSSLYFAGLDTRSNFIQGELVKTLAAANILQSGGDYRIKKIDVVTSSSCGKIKATFEKAESADAIYNMRPNDRRVGLLISRVFPIGYQPKIQNSFSYSVGDSQHLGAKAHW